MAGKRLSLFAVALFLFTNAWTAAATTIDFESSRDVWTPIGEYYSGKGVIFGDKSVWYNLVPQYYPAHSGTGSLTSVGSTSEIYFTAPVSGVSAFFNVYAYDLLWQAFDSSDRLLGSVTISKTPQTTTAAMNEYFLSYDGISKVVLTGLTMDYFNMDDLSFTPLSPTPLSPTPTEPVPEPSTVFLLCAGIAAAGVIRRRQRCA